MHLDRRKGADGKGMGMSIEMRPHRRFIRSREICGPPNKLCRAVDERCNLDGVSASESIVKPTHLGSARPEDREQPRRLPKRCQHQQPAPKGGALNIGGRQYSVILILCTPGEIGSWE